MKIEKIRFKNLASLAGEWQIDLTDPVFADAGIFALSGPVGSGKSTIFDAIRLALYGRTSRLDRVNQSDNEIMTRGTKECFAEVVFSNDKGRFLCRWSQHGQTICKKPSICFPSSKTAPAKAGFSPPNWKRRGNGSRN